MKSRSLILLTSSALALSAGGAVLLVSARFNSQAQASSPTKDAPQSAVAVADQPLAPFQIRLLEQAFKTASVLPTTPHLKNRARLQQDVAAACFKLDQPRRALAYIEQIENWRRGEGLADFAFYCAQHGDTTGVQHYLDLAQQVAESSAKLEDSQDWQIDRIKVTIAKTHVWLGHGGEAARLEAGTADFEAGKVEAVKAMLVDEASFDTRMKELEATVATGNFDQTAVVLETYAQLFNRFYDHRDERARIEHDIKASWTKLPPNIRIETAMKLSGFASDHEDRAKALELLNEAQSMFGEAKWTPEFQIPLMARLARVRHRAGDEERARKDTDAALAIFDAKQGDISNVERAGVLREIAETYQAMGDTPVALTVYKRAIDAGVENPNSRPRAEDLSATCRSMALNAVEPDAELWTRITKIHDALGEPW